MPLRRSSSTALVAALAVCVGCLAVALAGSISDRGVTGGERERVGRRVLDEAARCAALNRARSAAGARGARPLDAAYAAALERLRTAVAEAGDGESVSMVSRLAGSEATDERLLAALELAAARSVAEAAAAEAHEVTAAALHRTAWPLATALLAAVWGLGAAARLRAEARRLDRALPRGRAGEGLVARADRLAGKAAGALRQQIALVGERVELARLLHESAVAEEALRREVRENRARIERLEVSQMNDELTGVLNFKYFLLRLGEALEEFAAAGRPFCLLALDLDDFKGINDGYGHHVGDAALVEFAAVLRGAVRHDDVVFRKSGDEFYVLMPGAAPSDGEALAARLLETVEAAEVVYEGAGERYRVGLATSIGVLHCGQVDAHLLASLSRDQLLSETYGFADAALFKAKYAGKGCARIYTTGLTVHGVNPAEYPPDLDPLHRETRSKYPRLAAADRDEFNAHLAACRRLLSSLGRRSSRPA
jgi:diguanylate cyclase (GGDEF)-like protein